jgi:tetratricopeptide (TPR) repeat protein
MNLALSTAKPRGAIAVAALFTFLFLSYFSIRNARAVHFAAMQTPAGLERAVQLEPDDARNWYLLGRYWQYNLENPDTPRAIESYLAALAVNPASADAWLDLAMAYEADGNIPAARDAFFHGRKAYPLSAEGAWRYGNFLLRQGQLEPAFREMRQAVDTDPRHGAEAFSRSLRAEPDIDKILAQVLPPLTNVYLDVIRDQVSDGNTGNALKVWDRLTALRPHLSLPEVFSFVEVLRSKQQISDARRVWQQAADFAGFSNLGDPPDSVLWDGGFESGVSGAGFAWVIPPNTPAVQMRRDTREKHSGNYSLRLTFAGTSNINFLGVCHSVPIQRSTIYQFSAWVRPQGLTTNESVRFELQGLGAYVGPAIFTPEVHGTAPWTRIEMAWSSGTEFTQAQVCLARFPTDQPENKIQGTVWIDDVALIPISSEPSKP